jgi:DNA-binding NarL/FixJ family response regulator
MPSVPPKSLTVASSDDLQKEHLVAPADAGRLEFPRISLVLADAHPITLDGLERLFSGPDFIVAARCSHGEDTIRAVRRYRPDILLLDPRLPGKDGRTVAKELKRDRLPTRIVLLATSLEEDHIS